MPDPTSTNNPVDSLNKQDYATGNSVLVVFDVDGTMVNGQHSHMQAIKETWENAMRTVPDIPEASRALSEQDLRLAAESDFQIAINLIASSKADKAGLKGDAKEAFLDAIDEHLDRKARETYTKRKSELETQGEKELIYEGIPETLKELQAKGYKLAVITKRKDAFRTPEQKELLEPYFDAVIELPNEGKAAADNMKGADDLMKAIKKAGLPPDTKVIMLGDSQEDMRMVWEFNAVAEKAGHPQATALHADWGYVLNKSLEKAESPHIKVENVSDILNHITNNPAINQGVTDPALVDSFAEGIVNQREKALTERYNAALKLMGPEGKAGFADNLEQLRRFREIKQKFEEKDLKALELLPGNEKLLATEATEALLKKLSGVEAANTVEIAVAVESVNPAALLPEFKSILPVVNDGIQPPKPVVFTLEEQTKITQAIKETMEALRDRESPASRNMLMDKLTAAGLSTDGSKTVLEILQNPNVDILPPTEARAGSASHSTRMDNFALLTTRTLKGQPGVNGKNWVNNFEDHYDLQRANPDDKRPISNNEKKIFWDNVQFEVENALKKSAKVKLPAIRQSISKIFEQQGFKKPTPAELAFFGGRPRLLANIPDVNSAPVPPEKSAPNAPTAKPPAETAAPEVTGVRIALWAYDGNPITTLTVPIPANSPLETKLNINGVDFSVDTGRNRFGGVTFGDQLILDTRMKDPKVILEAVSKLKGPLSIEVVAKPDQAMDMGNAFVVTPEQLTKLAAGATLTSRQKMGHTVHTITFDNIQDGLTRLQELDPRFKELPRSSGVRETTSGEPENSKSETLEIKPGSPELANGKPKFATPKVDEYLTRLGTEKVVAPVREATSYEPLLGDTVFKSIDNARKLGISKRQDVTFDFNGNKITIPYKGDAIINLGESSFKVAPGQSAQEAFDASQQLSERAKNFDAGSRKRSQTDSANKTIPPENQSPDKQNEQKQEEWQKLMDELDPDFVRGLVAEQERAKAKDIYDNFKIGENQNLTSQQALDSLLDGIGINDKGELAKALKTGEIEVSLDPASPNFEKSKSILEAHKTLTDAQARGEIEGMDIPVLRQEGNKVILKLHDAVDPAQHEAVRVGQLKGLAQESASFKIVAQKVTGTDTAVEGVNKGLGFLMALSALPNWNEMKLHQKAMAVAMPVTDLAGTIGQAMSKTSETGQKLRGVGNFMGPLVLVGGVEQLSTLGQYRSPYSQLITGTMGTVTTVAGGLQSAGSVAEIAGAANTAKSLGGAAGGVGGPLMVFTIADQIAGKILLLDPKTKKYGDWRDAGHTATGDLIEGFEKIAAETARSSGMYKAAPQVGAYPLVGADAIAPVPAEYHDLAWGMDIMTNPNSPFKDKSLPLEPGKRSVENHYTADQLRGAIDRTITRVEQAQKTGNPSGGDLDMYITRLKGARDEIEHNQATTKQENGGHLWDGYRAREIKAQQTMAKYQEWQKDHPAAPESVESFKNDYEKISDLTRFRTSAGMSAQSNFTVLNAQTGQPEQIQGTRADNLDYILRRRYDAQIKEMVAYYDGNGTRSPAQIIKDNQELAAKMGLSAGMGQMMMITSEEQLEMLLQKYRTDDGKKLNITKDLGIASPMIKDSFAQALEDGRIKLVEHDQKGTYLVMTRVDFAKISLADVEEHPYLKNYLPDVLKEHGLIPKDNDSGSYEIPLEAAKQYLTMDVWDKLEATKEVVHIADLPLGQHMFNETYKVTDLQGKAQDVKILKAGRLAAKDIPPNGQFTAQPDQTYIMEFAVDGKKKRVVWDNVDIAVEGKEGSKSQARILAYYDADQPADFSKPFMIKDQSGLTQESGNTGKFLQSLISNTGTGGVITNEIKSEGTLSYLQSKDKDDVMRVEDRTRKGIRADVRVLDVKPMADAPVPNTYEMTLEWNNYHRKGMPDLGWGEKYHIIWEQRPDTKNDGKMTAYIKAFHKEGTSPSLPKGWVPEEKRDGWLISALGQAPKKDDLNMFLTQFSEEMRDMPDLKMDKDLATPVELNKKAPPVPAPLSPEADWPLLLVPKPDAPIPKVTAAVVPVKSASSITTTDKPTTKLSQDMVKAIASFHNGENPQSKIQNNNIATAPRTLVQTEKSDRTV